ncbi:MAG: helix-turn-helix transcriptional regulator [Anaerolineales bacterium]|nr:helix-turn-helix transcriptional regulator [Anaerolineales bacterium]
MSLLRRLLDLMGLRSKPGPRYYEISESLDITLKTLADHEGRSKQELLPDLLAAGLTQYQSTEKLWKAWETLSPRERDVTAFACLGLTNRQIAARLSLSPETVKTHIRNVLTKFKIKSKDEMRHILKGWDFSSWL